MLTSYMAASSLSPTLFRVRRKRAADPHEALVISLKRAKHTHGTVGVASCDEPPIICQRTPAYEVQASFLLP
ncbi:unnamed protein product [Gongylonema pulchrum]|uniref:Uncharacterized protein n=1 Tax=Gongylonema pulchrum TaxID=637853 RepID=A0A183EYF6_9BILA|nr:unnamed protein product [Gongylonema pulchrum]